MNNTMLNFYVNNKITTEHIDIDGYGEYIQKRKNLYRQLGIPILAIKDADILEVGPGVGHNTIPLITKWGAKHVDMLEPNPVAAKELKSNFESRGICEETYEIYPIVLEEYREDKTYDIVIAEGCIEYMENWKESLNIIKEYTHENSIVIVSCADEIGLYVERMKRIAGQYAVRKIERIEDKIEQLEKLWNGDKHKDNLKGMTRTSKEWILDLIFNEAMFENKMTMKDAMEAMEDKFNVLGASQNIFTDYSWYKDLSFDCLASYKNQYDAKKHIFLIAGDYSESFRTAEENFELECAIKDAVEYAKEFENAGGGYDIDKFEVYIDRVSETSGNKELIEYNKELKEILYLCAKGQEIQWKKYNKWIYTYGKAMQYISFQRK